MIAAGENQPALKTRMSEVNQVVQPQKIENAEIGKEYEFEYQFSSIFDHVKGLRVEVDFGDGKKISKDYNAKSELAVKAKHTFKDKGNFDVVCSLYGMGAEGEELIAESVIPVTMKDELILTVKPHELYVGEDVHCEVNMKNDAYTYQWTFGGEEKTGYDYMVHAFEEEGLKEIWVKLVDANGKVIGETFDIVDVQVKDFEEIPVVIVDEPKDNEGKEEKEEKTLIWAIKETVPTNKISSSHPYELQAIISDGSYTQTSSYVGNSSDYYNPPKVNGESASGTFNWTSLNRNLEPGKEISIKVNGSLTADTCSYFNFYEMGIGFNIKHDAFGWYGFDYVYGDDLWPNTVSISRDYPSAEAELVAQMPQAGSEGEILEIHVGSNSGASFIYRYTAKYN